MYNVLIIGAGSMGLATGYHLDLAGAKVTFLIRPHHKKDLDRPQVLYSLDDNSVKQYTGYTYLTDPSEIAGKDWDFIVVTLDRIGLKSEEGVKLVKKIGEVVRDSKIKTGVLVGTVGIGIRPWFLETSGIPDDQVTNAVLGVQCYPPRIAKLPINGKQLPDADQAYVHCYPYGFCVDDTSRSVAEAFSKLYNKCGVSKCAIKPAGQYASELDPCFVIFAGCELMNWPKFSEIEVNSDLWKLTVKAAKEVQGLDIHGEAGKKLASETTEKGLAGEMVEWEKSCLPLGIRDFNRYHHGGKVVKQDRIHLRECVEEGEREGKDMSGLREVLRRLGAN
ncbi:DEKNAAC103150 [Brettanomyces naardenensis]|uniref:DEKNAAC103150 n=1 Tax=Brettanomyces naardenensis TaxID=13370 RepID=A0A448YMM0_BRENA|nr:DEKNAAC103150 [Brettanomyces naardenensis]